MKKLIIIVLLLLIFLVCSAPNFTEEQEKNQTEISLYHLFWDKYTTNFDAFITHLGFKESGNDWTVVNTHGYLGEFQFGPSALKRTGYGHITSEKFIEDPTIFPREDQIVALKTLILHNELDLNRKISKFSNERYSDYIGKTINGIYITKAGLLAGIHLGGLGGVRTFLITNGKVDKGDAYGTKISKYIREFSFYNLNRDYLKIEEYINNEKYLLDDNELLRTLFVN